MILFPPLSLSSFTSSFLLLSSSCLLIFYFLCLPSLLVWMARNFDGGMCVCVCVCLCVCVSVCVCVCVCVCVMYGCLLNVCVFVCDVLLLVTRVAV